MVDLLNFKTNLDFALKEAVLNVEESKGHILVDIVPTAVVTMMSHLKSKKGFSFDTLNDVFQSPSSTKLASGLSKSK